MLGKDAALIEQILAAANLGLSPMRPRSRLARARLEKPRSWGHLLYIKTGRFYLPALPSRSPLVGNAPSPSDAHPAPPARGPLVRPEQTARGASREIDQMV